MRLQSGRHWELLIWMRYWFGVGQVSATELSIGRLPRVARCWNFPSRNMSPRQLVFWSNHARWRPACRLGWFWQRSSKSGWVTGAWRRVASSGCSRRATCWIGGTGGRAKPCTGQQHARGSCGVRAWGRDCAACHDGSWTWARWIRRSHHRRC